jgi:hypothetical protein
MLNRAPIFLDYSLNSFKCVGYMIVNMPIFNHSEWKIFFFVMNQLN